jgi:hypothetical protein
MKILLAFLPKTVSGTHNALYKVPLCLYMILRESFKYSLVTVMTEVKHE